ncbi:MAG TPA: hypothetical protein EYP77_07240 [Anaerolineae bacterium]|nr:hypothetical protein [Anaerolineae bacterium]
MVAILTMTGKLDPGGINTPDDVMRLFPNLVAHIICASQGYATPTMAAIILCDALHGRGNDYEWIDASFGGDPRLAVVRAINGMSAHKTPMADFRRAFPLVQHALKGQEPALASWF